jgi:hypothetical protein
MTSRKYDHSSVVRIGDGTLSTEEDRNGKLAALKFWDRPEGGRLNSNLVVRLSAAELDELAVQIALFRRSEIDMWDEDDDE